MGIAESVVRQLFAQEKRKFVAEYPQVHSVVLRIVRQHFLPADKLTARDLAWYDSDVKAVYLTRRALERSVGCVLGLIRHELGHASDAALYLTENCEWRADWLARMVTGVPVRYTADGVQHATHGKPERPAWLSS